MGDAPATNKAVGSPSPSLCLRPLAIPRRDGRSRVPSARGSPGSAALEEGPVGPRSGIDWPCLAQRRPLRRTTVLRRPEQSLRLRSGSEPGEPPRKAGRRWERGCFSVPASWITFSSAQIRRMGKGVWEKEAGKREPGLGGRSLWGRGAYTRVSACVRVCVVYFGLVRAARLPVVSVYLRACVCLFLGVRAQFCARRCTCTCQPGFGPWGLMTIASLSSPLWVILHLRFRAWFIFVSENKLLEELLKLACSHLDTNIEARPLLSAAWGPGLGHHGTASMASYPPAHTSAPAGPSELRYTPVHPLACVYGVKSLSLPSLPASSVWVPL